MRNSILIALALSGACSTSAPPTPAAPVAITIVAPSPREVLAAKRAALLDRLHDYWVAGEFPLDAMQLPLPVFRDTAGRECPMAAMITRSGHEHLVAAVVKANNGLKLEAITEGPLMDWMLHSGLTKDEVVMIQGIADLYYPTLQIEFPQREIMTAAAHRQVREGLRKAEIQLRASSEASLDRAAAALPADPRVVARGPVVPPALRLTTLRLTTLPGTASPQPGTGDRYLRN